MSRPRGRPANISGHVGLIQRKRGAQFYVKYRLADGRQVVLRVGPGTYVIYAHMKPGSVRVRAGERVRRGQLLGKLGNSGNSATPHLHLQVQVRPSFASDGLPFVFERFRFLGQITSPDLSDEILGLRPDGQLPFAPASNPGTRRNQMPLDRSVVRFP